MAYADIIRSSNFTANDIADKIDGLIPAIQNGTYTYGGVSTDSANAHAISSGQAPSAYANGQIFSFRAGYTNTGATTLNVNSLGAIAVQNNDTRAALVGGEIVAGSHYYVQYYSSVFYLLNPTSPQWISWTPTLTGFSADPVNGVYYYTKQGRTVHCMVRQPNQGTSNSTSFTISAPVAARTITNAVWWSGACTCTNNSGDVTQATNASIASGASVFVVGIIGSSWTASNGKRANFNITYEAAS